MIEYLFVLEAKFVDETTHTDMVLILVQSKLPLVQIDLTSHFIDQGISVVGIDFDANQDMWLLASNDKYYQIKLHTDIMLVDYEKKILYFKEPYDEVRIITP